MTNFKDFLLLQESLTKKTNYIKLDENISICLIKF